MAAAHRSDPPRYFPTVTEKSSKRFRGGAICWHQKKDGPLLVLLCSSSGHPDRWVLPAGGIDDGETGYEAAYRELLEEAGVVPKVIHQSSGVIAHAEPALVSPMAADGQPLGTGKWGGHPAQNAFICNELDEKRNAHTHWFAFQFKAMLDDWDEKDIRKRQFFEVEEAKKQVAWRGGQAHAIATFDEWWHQRYKDKKKDHNK